MTAPFAMPSPEDSREAWLTKKMAANKRIAATEPQIQEALREAQRQRVAREAVRQKFMDFPVRVTILFNEEWIVEDVADSEEICFDPDPEDDVHVGPIRDVQKVNAVTEVWFRRGGRSVPGIIEAAMDTRVRAAVEAECARREAEVAELRADVDRLRAALAESARARG